MFASALLAFNQLFTKPFRSVLWKMLGITLLLLALVWVGMREGIEYLLTLEDFLPGWAESAASIITSLGLFFWSLVFDHSRVHRGGKLVPR